MPQQSIDSTYFTPYQLRITPEIDKILFDLGMLTAEGWRNFLEKPSTMDSRWGVLHLHVYGAHGVVISRDSNREELVHWVDLKIYTKGISLSLDLDCVEFTERILRWSPVFFLRRERSGDYAIGIRVDADWWKDNKGRAIDGVIMKEERNGLTKVDITYEVLPSALFAPYRSEWDENLWKDAAEAASQFGWADQQVAFGEFGGHFKSKYNYLWIGPIFR